MIQTALPPTCDAIPTTIMKEYPMTFEQISLEQRGPVALITLERPNDLICLSPIMIDELNRSLDQLESRAEVPTTKRLINCLGWSP